MYVDTHIHFIQPPVANGQDGSEPVAATKSPRRLFADVAGSLAEHGVSACVAVQAAPTIEETRFLLGLADAHPTIAAVIGWLNVRSPEFADDLAHFVGDPRLKGIRVTVPELCDETGQPWAGVEHHLDRLSSAGLSLELLVWPGFFERVLPLLRRHAELPMVVGHLAFDGQSHARWHRGMTEFAALPKARTKISGLITQAEGLSRERIRAYVADTIDLFGVERVSFGSDWPVALRGGTYADVVVLFEDTLPARLGEDDRERVRANNAATFYGLTVNPA